MSLLALVKLLAWLAAAVFALTWLFSATGVTGGLQAWVPAAGLLSLAIAVIPLPVPAPPRAGE